MPTAGPTISVGCPSCGKRLKVPAERVGRNAKCPGCMNTFVITPDGAQAPGAAGPTKFDPAKAAAAKKPELKGGVAISWGPILGILGVLVVVGGICAFIFGPSKVKKEWEAIANQAQEDSQDVIAFGLQSYMSSEGSYDPSKGRAMPGTREFRFIFNPMVMSMPKDVPFEGTSTEGNFKGIYHPKTGEVEADVEMGGLTFAGLDKAVRKGNKTTHITGRRKGGEITAELDGKPAQIVYPKKKTDE